MSGLCAGWMVCSVLGHGSAHAIAIYYTEKGARICPKFETWIVVIKSIIDSKVLDVVFILTFSLAPLVPMHGMHVQVCGLFTLLFILFVLF